MKSELINGYPHIPFSPQAFAEDEMIARSEDFYDYHNKRRSVRHISSRPFPRKILDHILRAASTAPSGAHKQPWTFCVISSAEIKTRIREAAESEEKENYESRMSERWKDDLKPFATDWKKAFLEDAPFLIVVFKRVYEVDDRGNKYNNYYVNESVGIACGMLISAIHHAGLVTLTHTPSPMNFLTQILDRPDNERPFLLLPVGYAADGAMVPDLKRKPLSEIVVNY